MKYLQALFTLVAILIMGWVLGSLLAVAYIGSVTIVGVWWGWAGMITFTAILLVGIGYLMYRLFRRPK